MARDRHDGTFVRDLHPVRRIMPFVMPIRNGAWVLFEQSIPTAPITAMLEQHNRDRAPDRPITLFHAVLHAIGITITEFPRLNRFTVGSKIYARRGIWLAYSAKTKLERDGAVFTAKAPFDGTESLGTLADRVYDQVITRRGGRETASDREIRGFLQLPGPLLRLAVRLQRRLDAWNVLPAALTRDDPLYASVFVANLGSVGLDAAFHHLYDYGTIPIFVTIGRVHREPYVHDDGTVRGREVVTLRWTYDERVEDGFYAARALERLAGVLGRGAG